MSLQIPCFAFSSVACSCNLVKIELFIGKIRPILVTLLLLIRHKIAVSLLFEKRKWLLILLFCGNLFRILAAVVAKEVRTTPVLRAAKARPYHAVSTVRVVAT